jgi:serine/threonine protein kinase
MGSTVAFKKDNYPSIFLSATDTELPPDFVNDFSKYRFVENMTGGGSGSLAAYRDQCLGRNVAIKRVKQGLEDDAREKRRLLREARITAQLGHPNTVPVYELGRDDQGQLFFAMKKIEGEDLFRILTRIAKNEKDAQQVYDLNSLLEIVLQAGNAVAYAHAHGVIHRDLKPENILVGLYGAVYVMDWGIAKVWGMPNESYIEDFLPESEVYQRLTVSGQRPGTPLYMSPEQIRNASVDERSDIFSMGVVLYELLALREPFRGRTIDETFEKIMKHDPPPPSTVARHHRVPKEFDQICARCYAKDPGKRYSSMNEVLREIKEIRTGEMLGPTG